MNELSSSQRVLQALKEARAKLEAVERDKNERIAIIGMAGRFPGAKNIEEFWQNLRNGVNSIDFLADDELLGFGVDPEVLNHPNYVKAYASFEEVEYFDASFFGYSPREADIIDPQHRVFLECAWEALEQAGYDSEQYPGSIGVYGGAALNSYIINLHSHPSLRESVDNVQVVVSNVMGLMPTRVSYKLNLTGPSCGIQTGCSTSLVAVHMACQSLLNRECDLALAGGITISSSGKSGYLYKEEGIASPDGYCRAFDANAQGTVFGNGVGIVVVKRLSEALADGDCIYGVIKGSAINNDGSQKVGLTAPSVVGQAAVIEAALNKAGVEPETINYIETHGTGTALGDPIEIAALSKVFRKYTNKKEFCAIASVKTNIGHLDAAAGIAGLIKTVLALKHQKIPPSINFEQPNPKIDFENSPFYVNAKLTDWTNNGTPRRAGVSSFGMGGTNAHVIVEEAPLEGRRQEAGGRSKTFNERPLHLLVLSAKTETALEIATANLANYFQQHPNVNLADVAYTLQVGRRAFEYRHFIVCQNHDDAVKSLTSYSPISPLSPHSPIFLFPGQGSQYVNMGRELYETELTFREQIDRCCELLKPHLDLDLRHILYPNSDFRTGGFGNPPLPTSVWAGFQTRPYRLLEQTAYAQPALFVIEYALAQLWMSWGIRPEAMIGHSIGEYVAACLAGVFSLEDALKLVATRGRLMQQCPPGAMLSVSLAEENLKPLLGQDLVIAVSNAPELCVVSGSTTAIDTLQERLNKQGIAFRRLHTSHAFHSPLMEPILAEFAEQVSQVNLNPPQLPFISNVTGTWITTTEATDPNYWAKHLRQTVRFATGIAELVQKPNLILLEIGPGRTLSTLAQQSQRDVTVLTSLRHPKEQQSDVALILNTLGRLWLSGAEIDWSGFYTHQKRQRLPLPTYPFERQRYWVEGSRKSEVGRGGFANPPVRESEKKANITDWFYLPSWKRSMPLGTFPTRQKGCWLVFADEEGLGLQIVQRLEQENQDVVTVKMGEQFSQVSEGIYTINPKDAQDYEILLQTLQALRKTPQAIAHLWEISKQEDESRTEASDNLLFPVPCSQAIAVLGSPQVEQMALFPVFYSLLFLVQAIRRQNITSPIQIGVVTNELHDVVGTEALNPAKAKVLGLCKVIPQESPQIICRNIDVVVPESHTAQFNQLADRLLVELVAQSCDPVVAYRDNYRWVQTFEPLPLPEASRETIRLRDGGVYLIAGDLVEGLGLVYAKYFAQTVEAKLVLIGRSSLPEKEQWEAWLATHGQHDEISRCIRKLQALETSGTEFLFFSADLTDEAQMQSIIERTYKQFGQIHGVIHAGTMGDRSTCPIQDLTLAECDRAWHSKVRGLLILERVLQGKALDFYLLQSSLSSIVGGVGFAAYAGANLFMDALATQRSKQGSIPWFSVNWDACQLEEESTETTGVALVDLAMTPAEVWQVSERILAWANVPQIVVSPGDLQTRIEQWIKPKSLSEPTLHPSSDHSRPNLQTPYVAPRNEVEQKVAEALQELLGIEKVGIDDNFFELGGHSLLAIQAVSRLREEFQVELPMREFLFESPTVAGIAKIIAENQSTDQEAIAELLEQVENLSLEDVQAQLGEGVGSVGSRGAEEQRGRGAEENS